MSYLTKYQLFLFDFDGLLVNTEELHYLAYKIMMKNRGIDLDWSFETYCTFAHYTQDGFRKALFTDFPKLKELEPSWDILYQEKQAAMERLIEEGAIHLMPGVAALLKNLQENKISHVVVTHSPDKLVQLIRNQHPILNQIPYWITRHDYSKPKPDPECYQLAISSYSKPGMQVIGFEDTPRGLTALLGTSAKAVLVTNIPYPEIPQFKEKGVTVLSSLEGILDLDKK